MNRCEPSRQTPLRTLQIGLEWFPERPGGLNRVFYDLARCLPECGVGFSGLVTGSEEVVATSHGRVVPVAPTASALPLRMWRFRQQAIRRLKEEYALVAAHFALNVLPLLGALDGRPLVSHFHGPWASEAAREGAGRLGVGARHAIERAVYRRATLSITLSRAFARVLEGGYGIPAERIRVVPGGVDLTPFADLPPRRAARDVLGWPGDRPIVLAVRRLVRRMGLEDLVAAAEIVRRSCRDVLVLIAGSGSLRENLESRINARGLGSHVRLLGRLSESHLALAYRAADLTVVPTVALEGFGLIAVESLAAGTPVLVTPVGGLPEVVEGLAPGLVVEATGPAALADALLRALRGELDLPSADACREYAGSHYDSRQVAARVAEVYREAIG